MVKRLTKTSNGKVLFGVCSGFGEYFNVDPLIFRIALIIAFFGAGSGLIAYIIAAIIMPKEN